MPKLSLKSEASDSIDEHEVIAGIKQIAFNGKNEVSRMNALKELRECIKENRIKSEGVRIYDQLFGFNNEEQTDNFMASTGETDPVWTNLPSAVHTGAP